MKVRNVLSALIGIWFAAAPWIFGFADQNGALWTSVVFGVIQLIASLWAGGKLGWQNLVSAVTGIWFIVFPFLFPVSSGELWTSIVLGVVTVALNLMDSGNKS
ncbi:SPW repeat protein [Paenibacillus cremeus]|uniref:SPW repeat-containing integral membrane domain-containing protein n=1 Tax=Paenibacillus cremeus TaxID=2163881 RepID=A0A559JK60_9BACL|nr:SPW repeat protein [Paenibacillus cremeus]TVY00262.1 hypothetical protein FPZ49_33560 [Paenibacillus cremeus]